MASAWVPPTDYKTRPVAVLGGGILGRRIACCWASAGYTVHVRDPSEVQRSDALDYIAQNVASYALATGVRPGFAKAFEDLKPAVERAWLVFEAVPENINIKINTFAELEALAPADCILASNSSSYKSREMLDKVNQQTKTRILNAHYMMPPEYRIVELMTDGYTSPAIFPFLVQRHKEAGLHPIVARRESTGFVFNRIWAAIKREVLMVLAEGVSVPEEIDAVWKEMYGSSMGPCRMMDNVGLDTVAFIETHYTEERGLANSHVKYLQSKYIDQGKLGQKAPEGGLYAPELKRIVALDLGVAHSLKGKSADEILHSGVVLDISTDGRSCRSLVEHQANPDGIDYDRATKRFYWTNMGVPSANDGSVCSSNLDGSDVQTVIHPGSVHTPKQLVIDHVARKIYVSDREGLRVHRCNLDGTGLETLIQTGNFENAAEKEDALRWCVGIAVARKLGKIFWTQKRASKSNHGRIFSANIDIPAGEIAATRSDITCLIQNLPEPIDLEYDEVSNSLLWTDRGEKPFGNTLNRIFLDDRGDRQGSEIITDHILLQNFDEAIGLKLDHDGHHLYVSDLGGTIWKCDLDGNQKEKLYEDKTRAFSGLTLIY